MKFFIQEINKILKDVKKYWLILSLIPIIFIILVVIIIFLIPILILYSLFPFIFGNNANFYGIDLKDASQNLNINVNQKYDMGLILDGKEFEFKVAINRKSVIDCALNEHFKENPVDCFKHLNQKTGSIDLSEVYKETNASNLFKDVPNDTYLGKLPQEIFDEIQLPTIYNKKRKIAKYKKNGSADKYSEELTYEYEFIAKLYNECQQEEGYVCEIVKKGSNSYPFTSPSFKGSSLRYGYYKNLNDLNEVQFIDAVKFKGDPLAITNAFVKEITANRIVLENNYNGNILQMIYEGNFTLLENKDYYYYQEVLAIAINNEFTLKTTLNGKHFNPLLLFKSGMYYEDLDNKNEWYEKYITNKYVVKKQATDNLDLLSKVEFKQPFESLIITQLAKVPGVSDKGKTLHGAIDMIPNGGNIKLPSAISGVVFEAGYDLWSGYYITIEDPLTKLRVNYSHLKNRSVYSKGSIVNIGDILGEMGNTGRSFGSHLHMQITVPLKDGSYGWIDFIDYLTNYEIQGSYQPS